MDVVFATSFKKIKEKTQGLPSICRLMLYELLEYIDIKSGTIRLEKALSKFIAEDLHVESAPGRKAEKITPDTVRNAFRTIQKFRGDSFKFSTENQRIVIEMPFIRELYESNLKQEVTAVVTEEITTHKILATTDNNPSFQGEVTEDVTAEVTAVISPNNNIFINKNIKLTNSLTEPQLIADDFYPSDKTIEQAKALGFTKAEDKAEIQAFIAFNKKRQARWVDFNPIFLRWLKRGFEHQLRHQAKREMQQEQQRQQEQQQLTRSNENDTKSREQRLRERYGDIESDIQKHHRRKATNSPKGGVTIEGEYRATL